MFIYNHVAILCMALLIGGCGPSKTGFATLPAGTVVAHKMADFNNYVTDVNHATDTGRWAGVQHADAEAAALLQSKKVLVLPSDVKVEYLASDDSYSQVRLLAGAHQGEEVWTNEHLVLRPN